jgi:tetratricopeptide (TPR) repeat protein
MQSNGANAERRWLHDAFAAHSCRSHFVLLCSWNSLNSCVARLEARQSDTLAVHRVRIISHLWPMLLFCAAFFCAKAHAQELRVSPQVIAAADRIYSGDFEGGREAALRLQEEQPEHPIGYLLEAEALWWKIWCTSAEFKYGMTFPRHRAKLAADRHYLELATKATALAEERIAQRDSAEMEFYAGMGDALASRLYGLRGEGRNTARAGVRARERLLRAISLDADLADADLGLGLYNYYIDTLSAAARVLRFFMGIPGGSKKEGIRQLQHAIDKGILVPPEARFYLAINLHNYDQQYERALEIISPLTEKYPSNALFQLACGDLFAKLGRKEKARECYRAAQAALPSDPECRQHVQELVRASLALLNRD